MPNASLPRESLSGSGDVPLRAERDGDGARQRRAVRGARHHHADRRGQQRRGEPSVRRPPVARRRVLLVSLRERRRADQRRRNLLPVSEWVHLHAAHLACGRHRPRPRGGVLHQAGHAYEPSSSCNLPCDPTIPAQNSPPSADRVSEPPHTTSACRSVMIPFRPCGSVRRSSSYRCSSGAKSSFPWSRRVSTGRAMCSHKTTRRATRRPTPPSTRRARTLS